MINYSADSDHKRTVYKKTLSVKISRLSKAPLTLGKK
jgi:hypothetical protein